MSAIDPKHYKTHPSGIECIEVVEHFGFNVGNAIKYLWRCGLKGDEIEDLQKAAWYIAREIKRRRGDTPSLARVCKNCGAFCEGINCPNRCG